MGQTLKLIQTTHFSQLPSHRLGIWHFSTSALNQGEPIGAREGEDCFFLPQQALSISALSPQYFWVAGGFKHNPSTLFEG